MANGDRCRRCDLAKTHLAVPGEIVGCVPPLALPLIDNAPHRYWIHGETYDKPYYDPIFFRLCPCKGKYQISRQLYLVDVFFNNTKLPSAIGILILLFIHGDKGYGHNRFKLPFTTNLEQPMYPERRTIVPWR